MLTASRRATIDELVSLTSMTPPQFDALIRRAIGRYAEFVQELPASEMHHHSTPGGMLDHGLEVARHALALRRGHILPPGVEPEQIQKLADRWTYAIFTAALLHDIGKAAVDIVVTLYDHHQAPLGRWNPWAGAMPSHAEYYTATHARERRYRLHQRVGTLLAHHVVPIRGIAWLSEDRELFGAWAAYLTGDSEAAGILGQIIAQADGRSVAMNLGADPPTPQANAPTDHNMNPSARSAGAATQKPLHEKMLTALRYLLAESDALPLNRNGAAGWLVDGSLWLVSKRAVDAIRDHLLQEGHHGIPSRNDRLFDTLQEHRILNPTPDDRAIWKARVSGDGWAHDLTLLRIPASTIWPNPDTMPEPFTGTVVPACESNETMGDTRPSPKPKSDPTPETSGSAPVSENQQARPSNTHQIDADRANDAPAIDAQLEDDEYLGEPEYELYGLDPATKDAKTAPATIPQAADTEEPNDAAHDSAETRNSDDDGEQFVEWLRQGIKDQSITVNQPHARVHIAPDGIALVSPAIFRDFARRYDKSWTHVQKRFLRMHLHRRTESGTNIHKYLVEGERKPNGERQSSKSISVVLLTDPATLWPDHAPPPTNPHLRKKK